MNNEIELKLNPQAQYLTKLVEYLNEQAQPEPRLVLSNTYFDTPDLALSNARAALRIRHENKQQAEGQTEGCVERYEQTLKTRGTSVGGIHQRQEWDWPLEDDQLNIDHLNDASVREALPSQMDLAEISALFATNFQRQVWLVNEGDSVIELVLDQGEIVAGERTAPLLELELELKQGEISDMFVCADRLVQQFPMAMSDISKAERGYRLAGIKESSKLKQFKVEEGVTLADTFKQIFAGEFSILQRLLEEALTTGHQQHFNANYSADALIHMSWQLHNLRYLLKAFGGTIKRKQTIEVRALLDRAEQLLIDILPLANVIKAGGWPNDTTQALEKEYQQQIRKLANDKHWGQLTLFIGQWLLNLELGKSNNKRQGFNWSALIRKQINQLWNEKSLTLIQNDWVQWQQQISSMVSLRQYIRYGLQDSGITRQLDAGALTIVDKLLFEVSIGILRQKGAGELVEDILPQPVWRQWLSEFETEQSELALQLSAQIHK